VIICVNSVIAILLGRLRMSVSEALEAYEKLARAGLKHRPYSHSFFRGPRARKRHSQDFESAIRDIVTRVLPEKNADVPFTSNEDTCKM
jgi:hypothetical protein